ncbi:hypothetical protein GCM10027346_41950 [Hymenobacter seoulensis]
MVSRTQVTGYELVQVTVSNFSLIAATYEVELGTTKLLAAVHAPTNTLSFLVPGTLPSGTYPLKAAFAQNTVALTLTAPAPVPNPDAALRAYEEELAQRLKRLTASYDQRVAEKLLTAAEAASLKAVAKESLSGIPAYWAGFSADDKVLYLQLLAANRSWLQEYLTAVEQSPYINAGKGATDDPCAQLRKEKASYGPQESDYTRQLDWQLRTCEGEVADKSLAKATTYVGKLEAAWAAAQAAAASRPGYLDKATAFVKTFNSEAQTGLTEEFKRRNNLSDLQFGLKGIEDINAEKRGEGALVPGQQYNLSALVILVNPGKDADQLVPSFKPLLDNINAYNRALHAMEKVLPDLPLLPLPATQQKTLAVSGFTVDNLSDPRVKMLLTKGPKGQLVTFTAPCVAPGPLAFTFRLKVASRYGSAEKEVKATLLVPPPKALAIVAGNNQSGEPGQVLPTPLQVRALDAAGKPLACVEVTWNVKAGGGSLSAPQTKTDALGNAQVAWTLKADATGSQLVEATVKNADGSVVSGATATFSAQSGAAIKERWKYVKMCTVGTDNCYAAEESKVLTLYENGKFEESYAERTPPIRRKGTYTMTDKLITISFVDEDGAHTWHYDIDSKTDQQLVFIWREDGDTYFHYQKQ